MNYNISSSTFQHPLLKPILEKLTGYFSKKRIRFYVIGAMARDIIMSLHGEKARRATQDLDIAIAIPDWSKYKMVEEGILKIEGFEKDTSQKQRFMYEGIFIVDIVPFGDIMKEDDKIFWPPDETVAMTVLGFEEVQKATKKVNIDNDFTIEVASLDGVFVLKLVAWNDRNINSKKDADDMAFIIANYLSINEERAATDHYANIYMDDNFNTNTAGAKLLGIDVSNLLKGSPQTKEKLANILKTEIAKKEDSRLINQMLETHKGLKYEEVYNCLEYFIDGINVAD